MGVKVSCSQGGNIMQLLIQVLQNEEDKCMHIICLHKLSISMLSCTEIGKAKRCVELWINVETE